MSPPPSIGAYGVLRELGRGGMGAVYEGVERATGRRVALKVVLGASLDGEALVRFEREARLLARVTHPSVLRVHALEATAQGPVLVTELVEGAHPLPPGPLAPRAAAALVRAICDGVQAVHGAGVLHRDIKPQNVVLRADGAPVLLDFGLARELDGSSLTRSGDVVGTPAFMAPEQVEGRRDLDARTDVYALGALLYALLAGAPPFQGGLVQVLSAVLERGPSWPIGRSSGGPGVPPALEAIVRRAMARAPEDRQPSAAGLRDELDRWLATTPAAGRRSGAVRRRALWLGLASVVAALVLMTRRPTDDAVRATDVAAAPSTAPAAEQPALPEGSNEEASDAAADPFDALLRRARSGALAADARDAPLVTSVLPEAALDAAGRVRAVQVAFVGPRRLAAVQFGGRQVALGDVTPTGIRWSALPPARVGGLLFVVPCADQLAIAGNAGLRLVSDVTSATLVTDRPIGALAAGGGRLLYAATGGVWSRDLGRDITSRPVLTLGFKPSEVVLAMSPSGRHAAVLELERPREGETARRTQLTVIDFSPDGSPTRSVVSPPRPATTVAITDARELVTGGDQLRLGRWAPAGDRVDELDLGPLGPAFTDLAPSPRAHVVYACTRNPSFPKELVAWDPVTSRARRVRRDDLAASLSALALSPDGLLLAVGRSDGQVEVWLAGDDVP